VPRIKYATDYWPKNSFSMSYGSRKVIFPGEAVTHHRCNIQSGRKDLPDGV